MRELKLTELFLGQIDAKHELINDSKDMIDIFKNSFLMPENIILDDFLKLKKFFIYGLKGTGKTALLRYFALKAKENSETSATFILFKTDFSDDDKEDFSKAANVVDVKNIPDEEDYVNVWLWFFHRHIVRSIIKLNNEVFEKNAIWNQYKTCVLALSDNDNSSNHRFYPKLKNGIFETNVNFSVVSGKLGLDFEFADPEKTKIKFSSIVNKSNELFLNLTAGRGSLYIFLDELELSLVTQRIYNRDARIIRDVIIAIEKINTISRQNKNKLFIIAAIRSEVLTAVSSFGKEINKSIADFGVPINWNQTGGDIRTHPIIEILIQRIRSSERHYHIYDYPEPTSEELWNKYFPKYINEIETPMYILHQTWYRPRDVIRFLLLAQTRFPNNTSFDHRIFDVIRKQYSEESWKELSEELRTSFKSEDIECIKKLFNGYKSNFSLYEIHSRASLISDNYPDVKNFLEKNPINSILEKLYKIGFIGNEFKYMGRYRYRFIYRGDDDILLDRNMTIHRGLRPYLSIY